MAQNQSFLEANKFAMGSGELRYYMYNYRCKDMNPGRLTLVML